MNLFLSRCSDCGTRKEEYSDDEIGLCIVLLGTFVHRAPSVAACLLPEILTILAKYYLKKFNHLAFLTYTIFLLDVTLDLHFCGKKKAKNFCHVVPQVLQRNF